MSGRFLSELTVARLADGRWRLTQPLVFESLKEARTIKVPAGFETDFASVPRLPFAYWLFGGVADEAVLVHDFLYSTGTVSRMLADEVFTEACKAKGLASWRRTRCGWGCGCSVPAGTLQRGSQGPVRYHRSRRYARLHHPPRPEGRGAAADDQRAGAGALSSD